MYADQNFKTKKALSDAVVRGERITLFSPGFGQPKAEGIEFVEGPWLVVSHTWYAKVQVHNGVVVKVE